jgi:hypothetical protein
LISCTQSLPAGGPLPGEQLTCCEGVSRQSPKRSANAENYETGWWHGGYMELLGRICGGRRKTLLFNCEQHFDLYAYSTRRAPLGRRDWSDLCVRRPPFQTDAPSVRLDCPL